VTTHTSSSLFYTPPHAASPYGAALDIAPTIYSGIDSGAYGGYGAEALGGVGSFVDGD
jgi:hypothetical protein